MGTDIASHAENTSKVPLYSFSNSRTCKANHELLLEETHSSFMNFLPLNSISMVSYMSRTVTSVSASTVGLITLTSLITFKKEGMT